MKKRTVLAALIIIVSLGIYSQRGDIALRILPAAMEANLSANKIEQLGDGLHIGLCGAGGHACSYSLRALRGCRGRW